MYLFANAASGRHADGRGRTIRDESIAPVHEGNSILSLGQWVKMSVATVLVSLPYKAARKLPPSPNLQFFFSYDPPSLCADRTGQD